MLRQDEIMSTYDSFDPSSLTLNPLAARAEAIEAGAAEGEVGAVERALVRRIGRIADKANYDEVSDEWVEEAIIGGTFSGGINTTPVDAGQFATLKLWVRGRTMGERITAVKGVSKRMLDAFERGSLQDELFTSALLVTRQHGQPNLHVQLFRDVPISQVELLFPDVTVAMTTVDKLKIAALGGVGGIAAALKAATVAVAGGAGASRTALRVRSALSPTAPPTGPARRTCALALRTDRPTRVLHPTPEKSSCLLFVILICSFVCLPRVATCISPARRHF
jgi:hypothetical protein